MCVIWSALNTIQGSAQCHRDLLTLFFPSEQEEYFLNCTSTCFPLVDHLINSDRDVRGNFVQMLTDMISLFL